MDFAARRSHSELNAGNPIRRELLEFIAQNFNDYCLNVPSCVAVGHEFDNLMKKCGIVTRNDRIALRKEIAGYMQGDESSAKVYLSFHQYLEQSLQREVPQTSVKVASQVQHSSHERMSREVQEPQKQQKVATPHPLQDDFEDSVPLPPTTSAVPSVAPPSISIPRLNQPLFSGQAILAGQVQPGLSEHYVTPVFNTVVQGLKELRQPSIKGLESEAI